MFSLFSDYESYGVALNVIVAALPGPKFIILSMFNSAEHEIYHANKCLCIMVINVKMPTIVGILTFRCMINTTPESQFKSKKNKCFFSILVFMSS